MHSCVTLLVCPGGQLQLLLGSQAATALPQHSASSPSLASSPASPGSLPASPSPAQAQPAPAAAPAASHFATLAWTWLHATAELRQAGSGLACQAAAVTLASAQVLRALPDAAAPSRQAIPADQQASAASEGAQPQAGEAMDEVLGLRALEGSSSPAAVAVTWRRLQQQAAGSSGVAGPSQRGECQLGILSAAYAPGFVTAARAFAGSACSAPPASAAEQALGEGPASLLQQQSSTAERTKPPSWVEAMHSALADCEGGVQLQEMQLILLSDSAPSAMGFMLCSTDLSAALGGAANDTAGNLLR